MRLPILPIAFGPDWAVAAAIAIAIVLNTSIVLVSAITVIKVGQSRGNIVVATLSVLFIWSDRLSL